MAIGWFIYLTVVCESKTAKVEIERAEVEKERHTDSCQCRQPDREGHVHRPPDEPFADSTLGVCIVYADAKEQFEVLDASLKCALVLSSP